MIPTFRPWTHVWRQLHVSAVARCSDSYCIFLGVKFDLILVLRVRSQFFDFCTKLCTDMPWSSWKRLVPKKNGLVFLPTTVNHMYCWPLRKYVIGRDTLSALAPVLGPQQKYDHVTLFHCCFRGQHDAKYDIRVADACGIRGWRSLGFCAWTSSYQVRTTRFTNFYIPVCQVRVPYILRHVYMRMVCVWYARYTSISKAFSCIYVFVCVCFSHSTRVDEGRAEIFSRKKMQSTNRSG